jgi:pectinesterase
MRPQLTLDAAKEFTVAKYLTRAGSVAEPTEEHWDPTSGVGDPSSFTPNFTVAADGSGTHTTLQAALTAVAANSSSPSARAFILVKPGVYREVVCVDVPQRVTIYGADSDASAVNIVFGNNASKAVGGSINSCVPPAPGSTTYGPSGSATLAIKSDRVQLKNLTVTNDYQEVADVWASGQQAVALLTVGDRIELDNVRVIGNQFTTSFGTPDPGVISRVYVKGSYIAGDTQFIIGRATVVIEDSELHFVVNRVKMQIGSYMAATTAAANPYGFLVIRSRFTFDDFTGADWVLLGRSWDEGVANYEAGVSPNGQIVVRDSTLADHIKHQAPWGNALDSGRLFDCHGNRLYEYSNTGPGAAQ